MVKDNVPITMINSIKYSKIIHFLFVFLFLFCTKYGNTQINEWLKIYADEEGAPARFDHINFNIFHTNWIHSIDGVVQKPYSLGGDIGIFKDMGLNKRGSISFAFGLNYSFNNVHHNADLIYVVDSNTQETTYTDVVESNSTFKKNKLFTNFIEVPAELRFRKISGTKMRLYLGFKAGFLMTSNETRVTDGSKYKLFRIKNLSRLRYGPTVKVGVGKVNLYGFYALTPLFEEGRGPVITPFNAGLSFFVL